MGPTVLPDGPSCAASQLTNVYDGSCCVDHKRDRNIKHTFGLMRA
jgi:hypothetical protein